MPGIKGMKVMKKGNTGKYPWGKAAKEVMIKRIIEAQEAGLTIKEIAEILGWDESEVRELLA